MSGRQIIDDDPVAMNCVKRLKAERERRGLSQLQLSNLIGCHHSTISHIESQSRSVSVLAYNALAELFSWPRYKQGTCETLKLDFEQPAVKPPQSSCGVEEEQLRILRDIASIKGYTVSELLTRLTAPYAEALSAIRKL